MTDVEVYEHPDDEVAGVAAELLTDAEMAAAARGQAWCPEPAPVEDWVTVQLAQESAPKVPPSITPSQFTGYAFRMPTTTGWEHFSFDGRRHLYQPYDTPRRRVLMMCARQVEKSTMLGNKALSYAILIPNYKVLYVSPSATQTKTFSNDRIKDPIETSPVLKMFTTYQLSQNVFEKQFINRSKITLRYAFLNPDRVRGIPAHCLLLDELQDILKDNIPVIEACLSHSPEEFKRYIYSGTPKSLDNIIEDHWANRSTQNQWVVPCDACNRWNVLGEKNIGKTGLICERCGRRINPMHPRAQWARMVDDAPFEGFRVPQLMVPWLDWQELLYNYEHHPRAKFYNEVLGVSFDSGIRPLTMQDVKDNCNADIFMSDVDKYVNLSWGREVFAGIDWGTGENSYTVLSLGTYINNKFRIFYIHRFIGADTEPDVQMEKISEQLKAFNIRIIGADYGGGFYQNNYLLKRFGPERLQRYQYAGALKAKVKWEAGLGRWMVHRSAVMSDVINAIRSRKVFEFPRWREFKDPYGQDMLNIYSEYNEARRVIVYDHSPGKTDDAFHSVLYCFLASMLVRPRPDIIAPVREEQHEGALWSTYTGPTNQG